MLLMWSFNFLAGKIALRHLDPWTLAAFRLELAALLMLPLYFLKRDRPALRRSDLWTFAWLGFFGMLMNQGCFTVGLNYTTVGHSSVILAMGPILVLLLASAQRLEALTFRKILGMAISFTGVAILTTERGIHMHSPTLAGDLITLTGISGFAVYAVFGKKVAQAYDVVSMNTFNFLAAALLLLPLAIWQGTKLDWGSVGWAGWAGMFYMSAISSVAAYTIFYWALRHMSASGVATVSYFQPVVVILLGVIFLGEQLTRSLLLGGALVLLGVYLAERGSA